MAFTERAGTLGHLGFLDVGAGGGGRWVDSVVVVHLNNSFGDVLLVE